MSKIPKNAKKVFQGVIFDIYQWQQEMFDGSFQTFEIITRQPSSQIIAINENKKIIVLNEEQPHIGKFSSLIGGHVEKDETPIENAKKELLEETGMQAEEIKLWKITDKSSKMIWETHYFIAKNVKKIQKATPEVGEKIQTKELDFEDFIKFTQKEEFRNKDFQNMILKMIHENKLNEFKKEILE